MADELQGGLNAVTQSSEVPNQETPIVEESSKEALLKGSSEERLRKQRAIYDAHLQQMIDTFKGRTANLGYDPKLLAMSRGFLTPGKTGNFFESLGTAFGGYGEAAQEEQKLKLDDMLAKEKLLGLQLGQTKEDYALEKEAKANEIRRKIYEQRINKNKPSIGLDGKPNISDILSPSSQASDGLLTLDFIYGQPSYMQKELLDMYKVQQEDLKAQTEKAKSTKFNVPFIGLVEGTIGQQEAIERLRTNPWYQSQSVEGKKRAMQIAFGELGIGEQQPVEEATSIATKAGEGKKTPTLETTSQRELRKETEKVQSTEDIKAAKDVQKKDIENITKESKSAKLQEIAARDMFTYANDPALDKMFGILNSKPGYTSAFFLALKEPVRIGNTSIGVGQIEDILRLANVKDPAVIAAAERFKGLSKQIEANETRILLGGEGQITEGERRIVTTIVPTLSDPKEVVKAKAELTIARAQFDQARAQAFNAYMRQNKNATYFDFENDPDSPYQKLWQNYKDHTADIADSYSTSGAKTKRDSSATSAKSTSPIKSGGLWEAIQRAKEAE